MLAVSILEHVLSFIAALGAYASNTKFDYRQRTRGEAHVFVSASLRSRAEAG